MPIEIRLVMHTTQPITMKNLVQERSLVSIRYPEHSKEYVMYGEHPNGGITKVDSRNVKFLHDKFSSIGEIKRDLHLHKLQSIISR